MAATNVSPDARRSVEAARGGDESAWRELFDEHYPKLLRFFRSRVSSTAIAEDLAAETFSEAFRGIKKFKWRERPFGAWLFGIARNRLRMHYRSRREHEELPEEVEHVRNEYLDIEIRDALERLEPDHRVAIEYRYVLGLSGEEAAAAKKLQRRWDGRTARFAASCTEQRPPSRRNTATSRAEKGLQSWVQARILLGPRNK